MKKYDKLLNKVELFHRLAIFGDRKAFLQSLSQNAPPIAGTTTSDKYLPSSDWQEESNKEFGTERTIPAPPPAETAEEKFQRLQQTYQDLATPETAETSATPYSPQVQKVQEALTGLFGKEVVGPRGADGKLGNDTKKAIERFRAEYNVPSNATDQDVFKTILYQAGRKS